MSRKRQTTTAATRAVCGRLAGQSGASMTTTLRNFMSNVCNATRKVVLVFLFFSREEKFCGVLVRGRVVLLCLVNGVYVT